MIHRRKMVEWIVIIYRGKTGIIRKIHRESQYVFKLKYTFNLEKEGVPC